MIEEKKKILVELFGTETSVSRKLIVVELPCDCSNEEIKELGGELLDELATESGGDAEWTFTCYEDDFEVRTDVEIGMATELTPDVELRFDEAKGLVAEVEVADLGGA